MEHRLVLQVQRRQRRKFFVDVYNAADHTPDFKNRGIDAEGEEEAADTSHFANPGTFYLEVTTTCPWRIKVFE